MTPRQLEGMPLTAEEYAFVINGPVRAAEAAVADLLHAGALRINRDGELSRTGAASRATALQAEVLGVVDDNTLSLNDVVNRVGFGAVMQDLEARVRGRGLSGRRFFPLRQRTHVARTEARLRASHLLLSSMLSSAAGVVAARGVSAYPDPEIAEAFELARAGYNRGTNSCSGGAS